MGFLETMILLAGLGGGMYYFTYYVLPYLPQLMAAYQPQQQYQQPQIVYQPAPVATAPEPMIEDVAYTEEPPAPVTDDIVADEVAGITEDLAEPEEEESGGNGDEEKEEKDSGNGDEEEESEYERVKRTTKEFQESTDPKKDTRSKAELARAQKAAGFQTFINVAISRPYKIRGYYVDRRGRFRYYY